MGESPRRLLALVNGLPREAATWHEDRSGWTKEDEWSAQTIEAVYLLANLQFSAARFKGSMPPVPRIYEHEDRPDEPRAKQSISVAEFEARMTQKGGEDTG